jgi:hypothetical protein
LGWVFISLLLPIFMPFVCFWALGGFSFPSAPKIVQMVKDGQLGWVGTGFGCSTLYEIFEPGTGKVMSMEAGAGYAIGGAITFLFFSSLIAAVGTMLPVAYPMPAGAAWQKHYQVLLKSAGLTLASAVLYGLVHYGIVGVGPSHK